MGGGRTRRGGCFTAARTITTASVLDPSRFPKHTEHRRGFQPGFLPAHFQLGADGTCWLDGPGARGYSEIQSDGTTVSACFFRFVATTCPGKRT